MSSTIDILVALLGPVACAASGYWWGRRSAQRHQRELERLLHDVDTVWLRYCERAHTRGINEGYRRAVTDAARGHVVEAPPVTPDALVAPGRRN